MSANLPQHEQWIAEGPAAEEVEAYIRGLDETEYETKRKEFAKALNWRVSKLDALRDGDGGDKDERKPAITFTDPEPGNHPENGADILSAISDLNREYIVLPDGAADLSALWIAFTWTFEAFDLSPNLGITAPNIGSGKTQQLSFISWLARRVVASSNLTSAVVYRLIEQLDPPPTLAIDEAETYVNSDDREIIGVLNSGFNKRMAKSLRNVERDGDYVVEEFSTWAPKAFAFNGRLPAALQHRSIVFSMQRKLASEEVKRLRENRDVEVFEALQYRLATWANQNVDRVADIDPDIPDWMTNREADRWEPLFAIADAVGGEWPQRAREAARLLSTSDEDDAKVTLLRDVKSIFDTHGERISTEDLRTELGKIESSPWPEWSKGKLISARGIAKLLEPFGIHSDDLKIEGRNLKGYKRSDFEDAFTRYLGTSRYSATQDDNSVQDNEISGSGNGSGSRQNPLPEGEVAVQNATRDENATPDTQDKHLPDKDLSIPVAAEEDVAGKSGRKGVRV